MKMSVIFLFFFFPTSITFQLLTVTHRPYLIFQTLFYQNYHIAQAPGILKHIFKAWKPKRELILYYGKVKETYLTSVKIAKKNSFLGTKRGPTKKIRLITSFFFRDSENCRGKSGGYQIFANLKLRLKALCKLLFSILTNYPLYSDNSQVTCYWNKQTTKTVNYNLIFCSSSLF